MKKVLPILLLLAVIGGGIFFGTRYYYEQQLGQLQEMMAQEPPTVVENPEEVGQPKEVFRGAELEAELRQAGRLETAEYYYTAVESYDSSKTLVGFKIPGTTSRYIYSYDGRIVAGVDAERISIDVNEDTQRVDIYLPQAEILSSEIYEDSFKVYDEKNSLFNPISVENFNQSNKDLKEREEKKAIDSGLLTKAEENGRNMVGSFVRTLPIPEEYTVTVVIDRSGTHTQKPSGAN
jgi:hypothetical protein